MDKSIMFVVLVLGGIIALAISQEMEDPNGGVENVRKPGGCPEIEKEDPVSPMCADLCEGKDNCTIQACVADLHCEGSLKCCKTRCGTECLPPVFRSPCQTNFDCPWTLKCCSGVCDNDCLYQPRKPNSITKEISIPKNKAE